MTSLQKTRLLRQDEYYQQILESIQYLKNELEHFPYYLAIAFGSGIGELAENKNFTVIKSFDFQEIPHFLSPSVSGHKGKLIFALFDQVPIIMVQGRVHVYEVLDLEVNPVWAARLATFPWRVIKGLGVEEIITTHACGGYAYSDTTDMRVGDLGIIFDHTNLTAISPLQGLNDERLGSRFPSKSSILDSDVSSDFTKGIKNHRYHLAHYITSGSLPNYEGLGDISSGLLHKDIVSTNQNLVACFGMSMSFEADVINHYNHPGSPSGIDKKVSYLPIGLITNIIKKQTVPTLDSLSEFQPNPTNHAEVLAAQQLVASNFLPALTNYISRLKTTERFIGWRNNNH